jgi:hypothetical protein
MVWIAPTLRRFARAPMFTAIALVTLAIGIGANTAVFGVVNGILLKPLPYPASGELISVALTAPGAGVDEATLGPSMYFTFRQENRSFRDFGLWSSGGATVTGLSEPERVRTIWVTDGTLQALGMPPALGRWFTQSEDTPGTPEAAVLCTATGSAASEAIARSSGGR